MVIIFFIFHRYKRTFELNPAFVEMPDQFEDIIACAVKCVFCMMPLQSVCSHNICKVWRRGPRFWNSEPIQCRTDDAKECSSGFE